MEDRKMGAWLRAGGVGGLAWLGVGAVLVAVGVLYLPYALDALRYPYGLDYSEGLIWQQVLWSPGPHMYGDISHYPFVVFEYPPLYLLAVKALAGCGMFMLTAGRLVSILATLAVCALIGALVRRLGAAWADTRAAGVLAGLLPLCLLPVISWSVLMRVDMLALAFSIAGILLGIAALRRPGFLYLAVLAFVAACFTKQIYLAAALSMGVVWLIRAPRQAMLAYGAGGVLGLLLVAGLEWWSAGGFIRHVFLYNVDRLNLAEAWRRVCGWLEVYPILAGLVPVSIVLAWRGVWHEVVGRGLRQAIRDSDAVAGLAFLTLYTALTTLMLVSAGKTGASRNYFLEWMACWCVWLGLLMALALARRRVGGGIWPALLPVCLLLQLAPLPSAIASLRVAQFSPARTATAAALLARLRQLPPGPILSDDMVAVIESGRAVGAEPGILLELAHTGLWDVGKLNSMITGRDFVAIVTAYGPGDPTFEARYLRSTQADMLAMYGRVERFGDYWLRLPGK